METALAATPHLSDERREAVRSVASQDGVAVVEAGAGTGKTTLAKAVVKAAVKSGFSVIGAAPSWVAADELSASTGISASAIAKWRTEMRNGTAAPLTDRTLIIVDEAGIAGTRDLADVLDRARSAGDKVVLLGDRRQLASVSGASALRAAVDVVQRQATMTEVRRQETDWQRAASILMARGDVDSGLRAYASRDRIELVSGAEAARARVIKRWSEARARCGDDVLILTRRNRDATHLNQGAREVLRQKGRITGPDVDVATTDRETKRTLLPLAVRDRVRFGETLPRFQIRNGTRAVVERIGLDEHGVARMAVRLEDGRLIRTPSPPSPASAQGVGRHRRGSATLSPAPCMRFRAGLRPKP